MDESLTSYCGLCCADCIPSCEEFFALVSRLEEMLGELKFEYYAELKSGSNEAFKEYPQFLSILRQIKDLRCTRPCRLGGGSPRCEIRQCAQSKNLKGCWQCEFRRSCTLLDRLRGIHPNLDYHLDLIDEMGSANWFDMRKKHYKW